VADTSLRIDIASEFRGAKAFKQAENSTLSLEKTVKNLGKTLGITLSAAALINFGKNAAKAFLADEKAAARLTSAITNLGLSLSADSLNKYVERLSLATGVVDDQLRPALQALLQVTGSVTKSQQLLAQAVDVSAGSGEDLLTVSNDLAQAYVGNLKGLRKYNLGLTQAELKAASFADIQKRLSELFSGANDARLGTYAGKMEKLATAAGEAKENIGKGLVDALSKLGGSNSQKGLDNLIEKMLSLSRGIANVISTFGDVAQAVVNPVGFIKEGSKSKNYMSGTVGSALNQGAAIQQKIAELAAKKRQDELNAALAKTTAEKKNQLALAKAQLAITKAAANYDITKIQLAAALKGKVSEEDRKRLLELQKIEDIRQAIAEQNGQKALDLVAQLEAAQKKAAEAEIERQKAIQDALQARIDAIQAMIDKVQRKITANAADALASLAGAVGSSAVSAPSSPYSSSGGYTPAFLANPYVLGGSPESLGLSDRANTARNAAMYPDGINVNVSLDGQVFSNAVVSAVNFASSSGTQLAYTQTAVR
jgi:hypothetical protein